MNQWVRVLLKVQNSFTYCCHNVHIRASKMSPQTPDALGQDNRSMMSLPQEQNGGLLCQDHKKTGQINV